MAKLGDYLTNNKIDTRRVLVASKDLETVRPEDRKVHAAKKLLKNPEDSPKKEAAKAFATTKPRSGHPVTTPSLERALAGKPVSAATRARIARAVNAVLAQKKKPAATAADLF